MLQRFFNRHGFNIVASTHTNPWKHVTIHVWVPGPGVSKPAQSARQDMMMDATMDRRAFYLYRNMFLCLFLAIASGAAGVLCRASFCQDMYMAGCRNMLQLGNSFGGFKILLKWGDKKPAGQKGLLNMDTCATHSFQGRIFVVALVYPGAIEVDNAIDVWDPDSLPLLQVLYQCVA